MWDSVFWNEDNYRPDITTKTLNEIIKKLEEETQKKLADMFQEAEKQSEITETLTSSNKDEEKRREEQVRRENQSKDANENERRRSQATDQGQSSRNQTRNDKSNTNKVDTEVSGGGWGVSFGARVGVENSNTHNTDQQNEKSENAKKSSDEQDRKLQNKERIQHNFDSNSWADVDRISSTISGKMAKDSDSSRRVEISKEEIAKLLKKGGNVRVRYTTAELSAPIKIMEHSELTVTDEWNNLKGELKATTELLRATVNNLVITRTELKNAKNDLTKTRIDFTNKLEGTKKELE
ncbi:hypothetical protein DAPPUDRAFT_322805 [Daphnia pulex]|uniref:Uncharacterized protein n=1 Tax=Daphnia pulex TaxID=6669 RepID=E9GX07_DAPPU|nr:hypothetical protein DAPPUDRAFT_322805 [Daphnia pulex]|eukprot:EFX75989.1 hypothetical protein DAPPUDRAFT_322805 [Daphnia pulex]